MVITSDLDLSYSPIASKRLSISDEMSGDPQNDFMDDKLLLMLGLFSWLLMTVGLFFLGLRGISNFCSFTDDGDLTILGIFTSLKATGLLFDALEVFLDDYQVVSSLFLLNF
jgi:hypothetical protein